MLLALRDKDRRGMWSLPETNLFFTYDSPGPLNVNLSKLSKEQLRTVALGIQGKVLTTSAEDINELRSALELQAEGIAKSYGATAVPTKSNEEIKSALEKVNKAKELKKYLNGRVSTLKAGLPEKSVSDLKVLLILEKENKDRKSVVGLIQKLVDKFDLKAAQKIIEEQGKQITVSDRGLYQGLPQVNLANLSPVVESEVEEVTFVQVKSNEG